MREDGQKALLLFEEHGTLVVEDDVLLVEGMNNIDGVKCLMPGGTFYVFPSVASVCDRLGITSHGLAMYLMEGADDKKGVACLGGEAFGEAGRGFLRLSCAQPDERIAEAFAFMADAFARKNRVDAYLKQHPEYRQQVAVR